MSTQEVVSQISTLTGGDVRCTAAIIAMHGELASQSREVDWSDRPLELAKLSVAYADALCDELGVPAEACERQVC